MLPRITLLATGGTIASLETSEGLMPLTRADGILAFMPSLMERADISARDVFMLDSSNIQPEEWRQLAQAVKEHEASSNGIVITHGTDTMAYTASALSFMLLGLKIPVVLTGSQLPLRHPYSDAPGNLREAFAMAASARPGVYISFHHKVIHGTRAVKMRTLGFDAFDSINAPPLGRFDADGLHLRDEPAPEERELVNPLEIDARVFLLKMMPGTDPEIFSHIQKAGYRGLVLEAFGLGGLHYIRRNLIEKLHALSRAGIITLVTTQCLYEKADFTIYEVGRGFVENNIYGAHDMTTEAAVTKLMWALGDIKERRGLLTQCLSHEMFTGPE
ncbi:MAG: asparaginase [Clostridiales bacterium]|jgi:L-asparaginase|nr:asparaginase [Clostridiales bacterium]